MAPPDRDREIVAGHVAAIRGRGDGDDSCFQAQLTVGDAGHRGVGVEEAGKFAASRCRCGERFSRADGIAVGPTRHRYSWPLYAERPGVGLAVGRIVEDGKHMVEHVFYIQAESVKVALCCDRQV